MPTSAPHHCPPPLPAAPGSRSVARRHVGAEQTFDTRLQVRPTTLSSGLNEPRWTPENRPIVDGSKPANGDGPDVVIALYCVKIGRASCRKECRSRWWADD